MKTAERSYKICTIDKQLDCSECKIADVVNCSRHNPVQMKAYYKRLAVMLVPSFAVLIIASFYFNLWYLVPTYVLFWFVYQVVAELFVRCRHCPFWDESNPKLDCRINCGVPKMRWIKPYSLVRFDPSPLNFWEQFMIQAFSYIQFFIPFVFSVILLVKEINVNGLSFFATIMIVLTVVLSAGGIYFLRYLLGRLCKDCIHFSCPNNRQPYSVIIEYLKKNPLIYDAWKNHLDKYKRRK